MKDPRPAGHGGGSPGSYRVQGQDRITAEALYRDHARFVAAFARRLGIPEGELEDVVQEVFIVAHRKGGYEPGAATPRSWLGAITVRVTSQARRTRRRRREADDPRALAAMPDTGRGPQQIAETHESLARVQAALEALDLPHRAVFVMFEIEGERCEDIARALGVPTGTVYSRLHKARARFRAAYDTAVDTPTPRGQPAVPGRAAEEA
jgi:RNA polymerase sigma-70 factor, ECF subfamily